uniref:MFS domain-containing protein n=1 Tax=Angiostrongylus cantonensis TaxID=6313 RepID=A0A158PC63_ANGCA
MSEKKEYTAAPIAEDGEDFSDTNPTKTVDDFLKMGNYCCLILLTSEFLLLCAAGNMIYMIFAGSLIQLINVEINTTASFSRKPSFLGSAPKVSCNGPNTTIVDVCGSHKNLSDLTDCELNLQYEFRSLNVDVSEFYSWMILYANGRWVKSSISVQMLGVLVGTLVLGTLSDRYGRKPTLATSFITTSLIGIASSFSTSLLTFTVLRTILGFFNGGLLGVYGVYKMEHIPKQHRFWVSTVIAWAPNFILLNVIAYASHDWRTFQRLLVVVSSPALIMFFFISESPRWLIQKGRIEDARKVLMHIQHVDKQKETKKEAMQEMLNITYQKLVERNEKAKSYNLRHLFYGKEMSLATVIFCSGVFMTSVINYGLVFNIELLSGSFFINATIMGAIRWIINIVFAVLDFKLLLTSSFSEYVFFSFTLKLLSSSIAREFALDLKDDLTSVIRFSTILATATTSQSAWEAFPYIVLTAMAAFDTFAYQLVIPETKGKPLPENLPRRHKKITEPLI